MSLPAIKWRIPTKDELLLEEADELLLTAERTGLSQQEVLNALLAGELQPLSNKTWQQLINTDSWDKLKPGDWETAFELAKRYNRDLHRLIEQVKLGTALQVPSILRYENNYYKVAGNTRLMLARAAGQQPLVFIGKQ